jgi:hypothetical protein
VRSERLGDLNGERADASRRSIDQDPLPRSNTVPFSTATRAAPLFASARAKHGDLPRGALSGSDGELTLLGNVVATRNLVECCDECRALLREQLLGEEWTD